MILIFVIQCTYKYLFQKFLYKILIFDANYKRLISEIYDNISRMNND